MNKLTKLDPPPAVDERTEKWSRIYAEWSSKLSLRDAKTDERAYLAACQAILRNPHGCNTPFETFFFDMLRDFLSSGAYPTPDEVERSLAGFREAFGEFEEDALRFMRSNPSVAAKISAGGSLDAGKAA